MANDHSTLFLYKHLKIGKKHNLILINNILIADKLNWPFHLNFELFWMIVGKILQTMTVSALY